MNESLSRNARKEDDIIALHISTIFSNFVDCGRTVRNPDFQQLDNERLRITKKNNVLLKRVYPLLPKKKKKEHPAKPNPTRATRNVPILRPKGTYASDKSPEKGRRQEEEQRKSSKARQSAREEK